MNDRKIIQAFLDDESINEKEMSLYLDLKESVRDDFCEQMDIHALLTTTSYDHKNPYLGDNLEDKVMEKIHQEQLRLHKKQPNKSKGKSFKVLYWTMSIAALFVLGFSLTWMLLAQEIFKYNNGQTVVEGAVIESKGKVIHLETSSGDRVTIMPHTKVEMLSQGHTVSMMIHEGELKSYVKPRSIRPNFFFNTPKSQVAVVGTRFELAYRNGIDRLKLIKGEVEQRIDGKVKTVKKGEELFTSSHENHSSQYLKQELAFQQFLAEKDVLFNLDLKDETHPAIASKGRFGQESLHFKNGEIYKKPWFSGLNTSNFTVSTWVKLDQIFDGYQMITTQRYDADQGQPSGWQLSVSKAGHLVFSWHMLHSRFQKEDLVIESLPVGQWLHLTASVKNLTASVVDNVRPVEVKLYLNGELRDFKDSTYKTQTLKTEPLCLGRLNIKAKTGSRGFYPFKGHIDDMTLFNEVLTDQEILQIYEMTKPDKHTKKTDPAKVKWPKTQAHQWSWEAKSLKVSMTTVHIQNVEALRDGEMQVKFKYTDGLHALNIHSVQLLENGKALVRDKHRGRSGIIDSENIYQLRSSKIKAGGNYQLRLLVNGLGGTDSQGVMTVE